ncbi:DUF2784 domain-containing protein [Xylophilus sp. GOD-11R]|uniref:DUF2784 domain-containing protein n=1 Tax=Xylophilus sp. GOD-11R TaxID=3089814 RepID=UPI00298C6668|nr:DUF2784 domain-containing protein [Xylophilus sp. GOD-11R]WPB59165.1 DUF2784 domain-containing protein [Xylophilus sp. GOD-11R]
MLPTDAYRLLADAVLLLHTGVAVFIVGGLVVILVGAWRGWTWVRGGALRLAHLAAIGYVAAQSWFGMECPLTTLESWLRVRSGGQAYGAQGFIADGLQRLLFYEAPAWVFVAGYTGFAALVALAWWLAPPRWRVSRAARRETA